MARLTRERRRLCGAALFVAIGASLLAAGPASAAREPYVSALPNLFPRWSPAVDDYVTRCPDGRVDVRVSGKSGWRVRVGAMRARAGSFAASVPLGESQAFSVALQNGNRRRTAFVRCLPEDFARFTFQRVRRPAQDFYVVTPSLAQGTDASSEYVAIFDGNGVPLWWYRDTDPTFDGKVLGDQVAYTIEADGRFFFRRLDGTLARTATTDGGPADFHDIQPASRGSDLLIAYRVRNQRADLSAYGHPADAQILDNEIQEVGRDGRVTWRWSTEGVLGLEETGRWYGRRIFEPGLGYHAEPFEGLAYDVFHMNSVDPGPDGSVVASFRHTDAVYEIARDRRISWKLGGSVRPESLRVLGDRYLDTFGGQHDARLEGNVLTVYDNGTDRRRPPRAVRFRIDERGRTARLTDEITDPEATISPCCGSARTLPGGGWLVAWGGTSLVGEYDARGRVVFRLDFEGFFSYRAVPVAPGAVTRSQLRRGMNRMAAPQA